MSIQMPTAEQRQAGERSSLSLVEEADLREWIGVLARVHAKTPQRTEATARKLDSTLAYLQGECE